MCRLLLTVALLGLVSAPPAAAQAKPAAVSPEEARLWIRHTVPLPKDIRIASCVEAKRGMIELLAPADGGAVVDQAVSELREVVGAPERRQNGQRPDLTVRLQLGGPDAEPLRPLPNSSQSYRIFAATGNDAELRLAALAPCGLYYAAKTLKQLVAARSSADSVCIPLADITDWPDLEERGLWGSDSHLEIPWLAERKMNLVVQISYLSVDAEGRGHARLKDGREPMVTDGPRHCVRPVPAVLHLEQLSGKGIFEAYPNLRAKGGQEGSICYSQPEIIDVLVDWIVDLGSLPGVEGVDVWLAENLHGQGGCRCEQCSQHDRSALETRVVVKAWQRAKKKLPNLELRVLTSEETASSNRLVLRELPPEAAFWYYHSLLTYNTAEAPMIPPEVAEAARDGRKVGVTPNIGPFIRLPHPFTCAHFIRYRMNEFADKGLAGLTGYATPLVRYVRYNVEAAAEWSWNSKGRSTHEFALAWATREGLKDPEMFAEWSETLGPVSWDVFGSNWPESEKRSVPGPVARMLEAGELPPLGFVKWDAYYGPWGDIKTPEQLDANVAAAARAVGIAREMNLAEPLHESLIIQGYIDALKALWGLRAIVGGEGIAPGGREAAERLFGNYDECLKQAEQALIGWGVLVAPDEGEFGLARESVELVRESRKQMRSLAAKLGLGSP